MLTLGDLLDDDGLDLRLLVGGDDARERVVAGAHPVDVPQPSAWVDRDWLVLTAGTMLRSDPAAAVAFVDELVETGVAALGFGLEPIFDHVPEELLDAARARGLPVLLVPVHTPFREIVDRVARASLSEDVRVSQRLVAMQRYLMDALGDEHPQRAAVERVAALVRADVALLTRTGHVDTATTTVPADALWAAIASRPQTTLELDVEGATWVAVPVLRRDGGLLRWLVAAVPASGSVPMTKAAVQAAVPLLSAIDWLDAIRRKQERALRGVLLKQLVSGPIDALIGAQLAELGFASEQPAVALVVRPASDGRPVADGLPLLEAVEDVLDQAGAPFVAAVRHDHVVVVVQPVDGDAVVVATELADGPLVGTVGVGGRQRVRDGVGRSYREAELAAEHAESGPVARFESLGATIAILGEVPLDAVGDRAQPMLERLARQPAALETLIAYFEHDLNVSTTAVRLHLHPNSLRYRLSRIEEAIGAPLRSPEVIAAVYLALRARGHGWSASD